MIAAIAICALASCNGRRVYDKYANTPISGWEKNDTLSFEVQPLADGGTYEVSLGLRINDSYPFTGLTLIVEQHVFPSGTVQTDTVSCKLTDRHGNTDGYGISYYQYSFPVADIRLQQGDSVLVKVRHDMKREILPGISDVGVCIEAAR